MSNVDEQVRDMAKLTAVSGRINEIQKKNMEMYPLVFFNGVSAVKINFDLSRGDNIDETDVKKLILNTPKVAHYVSFDLLVKDGSDNENFDQRFNALESSIHNLFWKGIKVSVFMNGKLMGESKNVRRK